MALDLIDEGRVAGVAPPSRSTLGTEHEIRWFRFGLFGEPRGAEASLDFRDRPIALAFLRAFQPDGFAIGTLREVLAAVDDTYSAHRMRDDEALGQLAGHLVTRRVRVAVELGERPRAVSSTIDGDFQAQVPEQAGQASSPPPRGRREPPPTLGPDPLPPDRWAVGCDCLREASRNGTPFVLAGEN